MLTFGHKGDFSKTRRRLERMKGIARLSTFDKYGQQGVAALASATPKDTGKTASSWYYKIKRTENSVSLTFHNSNIQNGVPIAIVIQYGHGTGTGGWVEGRDYINPAIRPIFERLKNELWEEVTKR